VFVHRRLVALLIVAFTALAVPAWASAAVFTVNGTGDGAKGSAGVSCTVALSECTLRAAIETANESSVGTDEITFDPGVFNGEAGDTIVPATLLPETTQPVDIDGSACNVGSVVPCLGGNAAVGGGLLVLAAGESKLRHLSINVPAGVVGIRAAGSAGVGLGDEILDNTITMPGSTPPSTGIETALGSSGSLIEGNKITAPLMSFNYPIALRGNSGRILGNELKGGSCCEAGVSLEHGASGNQIGGDTAASENLIEGFAGGAVGMFNSPTDSSHNEVRRNRGANESNFVSGASVVAPVITEALRASAGGTAEPGATVRLFRKQTESAGEIEGFLGEAEADSVSGAWKVTFTKAPVGTFVAATQTLSGSTSGLGESATLIEGPQEKAEREKAEKEQKAAEEREAAENAAKEKEAAEKGGGGGSGSSGSSNPAPAPGSQPAPTSPALAPTAPKVRITKGPKKSSTATTAKFKFKAEPAAGAKFECKLDGAKWGKCRSPKTYKKLKVGKHTFRVRAVAGGPRGPVTKFPFTVKS
jgi:CSLREA domain-containing protein